MSLFKRYESDDFDESYDHDDFIDIDEEVEETRSSRPFMLRAVIALVAVIGIAYGANIVLTGPNGSSRLEFGQGKVLINAACDQVGGITVTPYAGFINDSQTAKFTLDSILFENVDDTCVGKDFVVQVWSDTGTTAETISETATGGTYTTRNSVRFYFQDSATVTMMSNQYTDIELLTDTSTATEFNADQSSFQLVFDPDQASSFGNAQQIYKITVQTQDHTAHD